MAEEMRRSSSSNSALHSDGSFAEPASIDDGDVQKPAAHASLGDYYVVALAGLLLGYAIFGKVFAYFGIAPLYVGEIVFAAGIIFFLTSRCALATLATLPSIFLGLLLGWAVVRTLPYLGEYGVDALRDSVIVIYGGFAFIVTALLLEKPERLPLTINFLRVLGTIIVPLAPFLVFMSDQSYMSATGDWALAFVKIGTTSVHLAAAALLVLLGFRRPSVIWLILLIVGMAAAASQNRGGMLVIIAMLAFAMIATGKLREFASFSVIALLIFGLAYALDLSISTPRMRDMSARQLIDNFLSTFGPWEGDLNATREWRMNWWHMIYGYTFEGAYFWTGKGFGINLALDDGFVTGNENVNAPLLRSPHNGHLDILARTGVPGLMLWLLTFASWTIMLFADTVRARRHGDEAWANFFLLIFCYGLGFLLDAMFDVTLEGPMAGIWFWCVFGVGMGASMIYRAEIRGVELGRSGYVESG